MCNHCPLARHLAENADTEAYLCGSPGMLAARELYDREGLSYEIRNLPYRAAGHGGE